jgi:hypothetical protein
MGKKMLTLCRSPTLLIAKMAAGLVLRDMDSNDTRAASVHHSP